MTAPGHQLDRFFLATKLTIPPRRPALVTRSRLMEALDGAVAARLTLVAAPPGFGKTTIVAEWARARGGVAWVSLDAEDNDVVRFWSYVFQALDQVAPGIGSEPLGLLQRPQSGAVDRALTLLINGVAAWPGTVVLVLDDYHLIDSAEIHRALLFLIEHLPENLRVVLATRSDPPIPLMRLRVRGQLAELRAADLRFTVHEVAEFLNGVMNLSLSPDEVLALEARSEGWIAGLQLAALSLQGRQDVHAFIESFTGSNRFIVDYLTEEILLRQPQEVRSFLLDTSILDRLSGPLCDAVALRQDSEEVLTSLERSNLFIIPLDEDRQWYRYHRLFADALRSRLQREDPERSLVLHERAGRWYEEEKLAAEAVEHALASEVFAWAADLIERATATIWRSGELETLLRWLRALPPDILQTRPKLILIEAWSEFLADRFDAVERHLRQVEKLIADGDTTPNMAAVVAAIRASLGSMREDDPSETIAWAERALGALPHDYRTWRSVAAMALGLAYDSLSLPGPAADALDQAVGIAMEAGDYSIAALAIWNWARVCQIGGEMTAVLARCRTLLAEMKQRQPASSINLGYIRASIGRLLFQRNEVDEAAGLLRQAVTDMEPGGLPRPLLDCYVRLARVETARRDTAAAEMWLERADDLMQRSGLASGRLSRLEPWHAWFALEQGDVEAAEQWLVEYGPTDRTRIADLDIGGNYWIEGLALARLWIAQGQPDDALALLARMAAFNSAKGRFGVLTEILAVTALAHAAAGDGDQALTVLDRAVALGAPDHFMRIFLGLGESMRALVARLTPTDLVEQAFVASLLDAFAAELDVPAERPGAVAGPPPFASAQPLVEPLTERELEVLRLLATGAPNRDIADALFVSLPTVKKHVANILRKLDVANRTQAVARARDVGIIQE